MKVNNQNILGFYKGGQFASSIITGNRRAGYSSEALAYFARLSDDPSSQYKSAANRLIATLKTSGVWSKLDAFYVPRGAPTEADSYLNWVADAFNMTQNGAVTWDTDSGLTGDASTGYMSTGFLFNGAGQKFLQNSAHLGVWETVNTKTGTFSAGASADGRNQLCTASNSNVAIARINSVTSSVPASSDARAHLVATRNDASTQITYINGAQAASQAVASVALTSAELFLLRSGTTYSGKTVGAAHIGAGLTADEVAAIYSALGTFWSSVNSVEVDVFLTAGQSNSAGVGDQALSPASPTGLMWTGSALALLDDPVGLANTGSAWPAFANAWYARTGRRAVIVPQGRGSTSLIADVPVGSSANGTWAASGTLRGTAVTEMNEAIAALESARLDLETGVVNYRIANKYVIWCQGESEGQSVNGTTVTGAIYKTRLREIADYFDANITSGIRRMGVVRTGVTTNSTWDAGFAEIRQAQDEACAENPDILEMVYTGAVDFITRGLMSDSVHYTQEGYDEIGEFSAETLTP
jgi:hypothetical protein